VDRSGDFNAQIAWTLTIVMVGMIGFYGLFGFIGVHGWSGAGLGVLVGFVGGSLWTGLSVHQERN